MYVWSIANIAVQSDNHVEIVRQYTTAACSVDAVAMQNIMKREPKEYKIWFVDSFRANGGIVV